MADLKYYRDEQARHPALHAEHCVFDDAVTAIHKLAAEYDVKSWVRNVERTSGCISPRWQSGTGTITLNTDCLNWLTVIHEFAHALDWKLRRPVDGSKKFRFHGVHHASLVDELAKLITKREWITDIAARRVRGDLLRIEARRMRVAYQHDPKVIRANRIARRRMQVKRLTTRIKMLTTRLAKAQRSLAALERADARRETP